MRMQNNWMFLATIALVTSGRRITDLQRTRKF
jgi:hypothetical protein